MKRRLEIDIVIPGAAHGEHPHAAVVERVDCRLIDIVVYKRNRARTPLCKPGSILVKLIFIVFEPKLRMVQLLKPKLVVWFCVEKAILFITESLLIISTLHFIIVLLHL